MYSVVSSLVGRLCTAETTFGMSPGDPWRGRPAPVRAAEDDRVIGLGVGLGGPAVGIRSCTIPGRRRLRVPLTIFVGSSGVSVPLTEQSQVRVPGPAGSVAAVGDQPRSRPRGVIRSNQRESAADARVPGGEREHDPRVRAVGTEEHGGSALLKVGRSGRARRL